MSEYIDVANRIDNFDLRLVLHYQPNGKKVFRDINIRGRGLVRTVFMLMAAGPYGSHNTKFPRDHLARMEEIQIPFECFEASTRGTGSSPCWVRLDRRNFDFKFAAITEKEPAS